jgi:hypothetical protein
MTHKQFQAKIYGLFADAAEKKRGAKDWPEAVLVHALRAIHDFGVPYESIFQTAHDLRSREISRARQIVHMEGPAK